LDVPGKEVAAALPPVASAPAPEEVVEEGISSLGTRTRNVILSADSQGDFPVVFYGPRTKKLDIVMAHYDLKRTADTLDFWLRFLKTEKVQHPLIQLYQVPHVLGLHSHIHFL
jgi:hypothetical protein